VVSRNWAPDLHRTALSRLGPCRHAAGLTFAPCATAGPRRLVDRSTGSELALPRVVLTTPWRAWRNVAAIAAGTGPSRRCRRHTQRGCNEADRHGHDQ